MSSSNNNNNKMKTSKKRKYHAGGSGWNSNKNPRRGPPGMLLTCETGRESKCRREGLEILKHYYHASANNDDANHNGDRVDKDAPLSLEEELKQLRQQGKIKSGNDQSRPEPFQVYDTGCRGTVFVLCTLPNAQLIEPIVTDFQKSKQHQQEELTEEIPKEESTSKKAKLEDKSTTMPSLQPLWNPIATFESICADRISPTSDAPSSRFITRMIPVQATCFASPEELRLTATALLNRHFAIEDGVANKKDDTKPSSATTTTTFAIAVKRRLCENLSRDKVIEIVADVMKGQQQTLKNRTLKVDLDKPDFTIVVEICKTLCGVSIVKDCRKYQNFNLFTVAATPAGESEEEKEQENPNKE